MPNPFTSFNDWWPDVVDSFFGSPSTAWDRFKNGKTNEINQQIAEQNLGYQRERNAIEDARYAEETAYNRAFASEEQAYQRAFAEEQRDYQRALQQQIFEREDTALERQASSLSEMGINPLSQQLNGLGAGQAVTPASAPGSASAGAMSSRGGSALHNDFNMQDKGIFESLSPLLSLASTINGVKTGEYQRDSLALQNDKQYLENLARANQLGINYKGYMAAGGNYRENKLDFYTPDGTHLFDTPEYKRGSYSSYEKDYLDNKPDWVKTLSSVTDDDVYKQAEKAVTKLGNLWSQGFNNLFDKNNGQSVYDLGKDKSGKFNPFNMLLNLFF